MNLTKVNRRCFEQSVCHICTKYRVTLIFHKNVIESGRPSAGAVGCLLQQTQLEKERSPMKIHHLTTAALALALGLAGSALAQQGPAPKEKKAAPAPKVAVLVPAGVTVELTLAENVTGTGGRWKVGDKCMAYQGDRLEHVADVGDKVQVTRASAGSVFPGKPGTICPMQGTRLEFSKETFDRWRAAAEPAKKG
jgi:hypothetical protein